MDAVVNFFFELGLLQRMRRSQRVSNNTTIAAHSFRVTLIGYILSHLAKAQPDKVIKMCLIHDIPESRIGDLDYINRYYCQANEAAALTDQFNQLPVKTEVIALFHEYSGQKTLESQLVHDADILEEILTEKEQQDNGHPEAAGWHDFNQAKLKTPAAKELYQTIKRANSNTWWYQIIRKKSP